MCKMLRQLEEMMNLVGMEGDMHNVVERLLRKGEAYDEVFKGE